MNKQIKVSNNCLEVRSLKVGDKIDFSKGKVKGGKTRKKRKQS